jgi:hypothetical protein
VRDSQRGSILLFVLSLLPPLLGITTLAWEVTRYLNLRTALQTNCQRTLLRKQYAIARELNRKSRRSQREKIEVLSEITTNLRTTPSPLRDRWGRYRLSFSPGLSSIDYEDLHRLIIFLQWQETTQFLTQGVSIAGSCSTYLVRRRGRWIAHLKEAKFSQSF